MKTIVYLITFIFSSIGFSQGNLQFNQVKLVSIQETVPAGKVWKVENAIVIDGYLVNINARYYAMSYNLNGVTSVITTSNNSSNISPTPGSFPFWIPAGSTLAAGTNMRYLSVLEFNIVQ